MKAVVFTLGCKVNEVESASVIAALESWGAEVSTKLCRADVYVLNTCAVTGEAEKKSRQLVARARKFNPEALIYVCGCASQKNKAQFMSKGVTYIGGAQNKEELLCGLAGLFNANNACTQLPYPRSERTRAFIKIEDGCNNFCSYCIIPYLRGRVRCRSIEEIVEEVKSVTAPEIVLTGINISAYNSGGRGLDGLISALGFCNARIRLGSLECNVIDDKLLNACKSLKNFAPQFHLSLQSGSNAVLKSMNRRYTREEYLQKCALIYAAFPQAAITCDIIAGFPTETEADFQNSLSIIKEAGFARVHAFVFSPREGTAAYKLKDLPQDIKNSRKVRLLAAAKQASDAFVKAYIGTNQQVIWEEYNGEYTTGYTPNYIRAYIKGDYTGKTNTVTLTAPFSDGVLCVLPTL